MTEVAGWSTKHLMKGAWAGQVATVAKTSTVRRRRMISLGKDLKTQEPQAQHRKGSRARDHALCGEAKSGLTGQRARTRVTPYFSTVRPSRRVDAA